jgi:2-polyprenyl-6-methoxyphenol hydroxylase-like FAD-dependent oxidoreductase
MGTGLAIVGAYVLAGELAAARGDHHDGFARYEATMRGYVKGCQKLGEGVANWAVPDSRLRAWLANQTYRLIPYLPWKGLLAKSARTAASAIVLDTYASLHSG